MMIRAARIPSLIAASSLAIVLAACSTSGAVKLPTSSVVPRSSPLPSRAPTPSAQPATLSSEVPTPSPSQTSATTTAAAAATALTVKLNSIGWVGGFKVQVNSVAYDPAAATVSIDVRVTNLAQADTGFTAVSSELLLDPGDGSGLMTARQVLPFNVIAESTATGKITFDARQGFTLTNAVLVLGKPANHQWLVPLQVGAHPTGDAPITLKTPALLRTVTNAYYRPTSAQLVPWSCTGFAPHTGYVPSEKQTSVVAINGTAGAGTLAIRAVALTALSITAPDGTTVAVIAPPVRAWDSNQSTKNELMCFPVPAHQSGTYRLKITDSENRSATTTLTLP